MLSSNPKGKEKEVKNINYINEKRISYAASQVWLFFAHYWLIHSFSLLSPPPSLALTYCPILGGWVENTVLFCFYKMYLEISDSTSRSFTRL